MDRGCRLGRAAPFPCMGEAVLTTAVSTLCLGATSSTTVYGTGSYAAGIAAPDRLTTTGVFQAMIVSGSAFPVRPYDRGKVVWDEKQTSGATAVFVMRSTGWGCLYKVWGVGAGADLKYAKSRPWDSRFKNDDNACITMEVNQPGPADNYLALGGTATLTVGVQGGSSTTNYVVGLSSAGWGEPPRGVPLPKPPPVAESPTGHDGARFVPRSVGYGARWRVRNAHHIRGDDGTFGDNRHCLQRSRREGRSGCSAG